MAQLLSEENAKYFDEKYPIIYKNKLEKKSGAGYYFSNAIEIAIKNNQIRAATCVIDYLCKF